MGRERKLIMENWELVRSKSRRDDGLRFVD
jgi:hypothetical protein